MDHLRNEIRQLEIDHDQEIEKMRRDYQNQIETLSREKMVSEREKNDALRELESAVRSQSYG